MYIYDYIYIIMCIYIYIHGILAGELGRQGGSQQGDIREGASHTTEALAWRGGLFPACRLQVSSVTLW